MKKLKYEYWRVPVSPAERRRLMVLASKKNCSTIPNLLRSLMLEALAKAEKEGLFNLSFLEQNQRESS